MNRKSAVTVGLVVALGTLLPHGSALAGGKKSAITTPALACHASTANTITVQVTAPSGGTGLPGGFSVHWLTCEQYALGPDGVAGTADDDSFGSGDENCGASFAGNANGSSWNLTAGGAITVVIGGLNDADPGVSFSCNEPLACAGCYVFRAFGHATKYYNRSAFSDALTCYTANCESTGYEDGDHCTRSQGYYGGNGTPGRDALVGCFGGDPTGASCTSSAGTPIVTIGGGTYAYTWTTTGTCTDVQPGTGVFSMDQGLANLRTAIGGGGGSGYFTANGANATGMGSGGGLASQVATLTLNLAIAGYGQCAASGCTDGSAGSYASATLCNLAAGDTFKNDGTPISAATAAALNGQTVAQVLAAANAYLGGGGFVSVPYGLSSAADLNELVAHLNLAFDVKDWDDDTKEDCGCGGMSAFAESHLCKP